MALTSVDVLQQSGQLTSYGNQSTETTKDLDKDAFLKILVAQLTYQDPLNPMDDKDFIAQLAQFTSLEQLTNIAGNMEVIIANQGQSSVSDAVNLIGKEVSASGYTIAKEGTAVSTVHYYFEDEITSGFINVYDKDSNLVYTEVIGAKQAGTMHKFEWDGTNYNGDVMADGIYSVGIAGENADGEGVYIQTEVSGKVEGVITDGGTTYLVLEDGRYLEYELVGQISSKASDASDESESESESETTTP